MFFGIQSMTISTSHSLIFKSETWCSGLGFYGLIICYMMQSPDLAIPAAVEQPTICDYAYKALHTGTVLFHSGSKIVVYVVIWKTSISDLAL